MQAPGRPDPEEASDGEDPADDAVDVADDDRDEDADQDAEDAGQDAGWAADDELGAPGRGGALVELPARCTVAEAIAAMRRVVPARAALAAAADPAEFARVGADLAAGRPVYFMPADVRDGTERPDGGPYAVHMFGALSDGRRAHVVVTGFRPFFEVAVPDPASPSGWREASPGLAAGNGADPGDSAAVAALRARLETLTGELPRDATVAPEAALWVHEFTYFAPAGGAPAGGAPAGGTPAGGARSGAPGDSPRPGGARSGAPAGGAPAGGAPATGVGASRNEASEARRAERASEASSEERSSSRYPNEGPAPAGGATLFARVSFASARDRTRALKALQDTAAGVAWRVGSNELAYGSYYRVVAREAGFPVSDWLELAGYQASEASAAAGGTTEDGRAEPMADWRIELDYRRVAGPAGQWTAAETRRAFEAARAARPALQREPALTLAWDLETYDAPGRRAGPPRGTSPTARIMNAALRAFWGGTAPAASVQVACPRAAPDPRWVTVCAPSQEAAAAAIGAVARLWQPDVWADFNGGGYDWPFLLDKLGDRAGGLLGAISAAAPRPLRGWGGPARAGAPGGARAGPPGGARAPGGALDGRAGPEGRAGPPASQTTRVWCDYGMCYQARYRNQRGEVRRLKMEAGRGAEIDVPDIPGIAPIDVLPCFQRAVPRKPKYSLHACLGYCRLPDKADMPIVRLWRSAEAAELAVPGQPAGEDWGAFAAAARAFEARAAADARDWALGAGGADAAARAERAADAARRAASAGALIRLAREAAAALARAGGAAETVGRGAPGEPGPAAAAAELMRQVAHYNEVDALRTQQLAVAKSVVRDMRGVALLGFISLWDSYVYAGGVKTQSQLAAFAAHSPRRLVCALGRRRGDAPEGGDKYAGALVLDPHRGRYVRRPVFGLDFNSLYPSIIRVFNLSPEWATEDPAVAARLAAAGVPLHEVAYDDHGRPCRCWFVRHANDPAREGLYARVLAQLGAERGRAKERMAEAEALVAFCDRALAIGPAAALREAADRAAAAPKDKRLAMFAAQAAAAAAVLARRLASAAGATGGGEASVLEGMRAEAEQEWQRWDSYQRAVKVYMNTFYGETGDKLSPFYMLAIALGITTMGQTLLRHVRAFAAQREFDAHYGDTDSLYLVPPNALFADLEAIQPAGRAALPAGGPAGGPTSAPASGQGGLADRGDATRKTGASRGPQAAEGGRADEDGRGWPPRATMDERVRRTLRVALELQRAVNADLQRFTGTPTLRMALEEVCCPFVLTCKKRYFAGKHTVELGPNFTHDNPRDWQLVRGFESRALTDMARRLRDRCFERLLDPAEQGDVFDVVAAVLRDAVDRAAQWSPADYVEALLYRPESAGNKPVQTYVRRMAARGDPLSPVPEPNERFRVLVVRRADAYDLRGCLVRPQKGDLFECEAYAAAHGLAPDIAFYVERALKFCVTIAIASSRYAGCADFKLASRRALADLRAVVRPGDPGAARRATGALMRAAFRAVARAGGAGGGLVTPDGRPAFADAAAAAAAAAAAGAEEGGEEAPAAAAARIALARRFLERDPACAGARAPELARRATAAAREMAELAARAIAPEVTKAEGAARRDLAAAFPLLGPAAARFEAAVARRVMAQRRAVAGVGAPPVTRPGDAAQAGTRPGDAAQAGTRPGDAGQSPGPVGPGRGEEEASRSEATAAGQMGRADGEQVAEGDRALAPLSGAFDRLRAAARLRARLAGALAALRERLAAELGAPAYRPALGAGRAVTPAPAAATAAAAQAVGRSGTGWDDLGALG